MRQQGNAFFITIINFPKNTFLMMWTYKYNLIEIVMELSLQLFSIGIVVFLFYERHTFK